MQKIDVVDLQTFEAGLHRVEDVLHISNDKVRPCERHRRMRNELHLAVETLLVDDAELLGCLSGACNVDVGIRADSSVELDHT